MKELEVTIRVRNNRLKQRRGSRTQEQLAAAAGVHAHMYAGLESMRVAPRLKSGEWRDACQRLSRYYGVELDELFPLSLQTWMAEPVEVRKLDAEEMALLTTQAEEMACLMPGPEDATHAREAHALVEEALATLSPREEAVLRQRFFDDETLEEVGETWGRSRERIREIEAGALRRLRESGQGNALREWNKGSR